MPDVVHAFMKQKHRMIWERRHGPVGSGMKIKDEFKIEDDWLSKNIDQRIRVENAWFLNNEKCTVNL